MSVEGSVGNFTARVRRLPRYVDESLCTACGTCSDYCPVTIDDEYNERLQLTKALHIDYQQAIPSSYHVDAHACLFLTRKECKQCERVCLAKAIDFKQQVQEIDLNVGAVVLAPGFGRIDKDVLSRYGYATYPDVITGMEFERLTSASGPTMGNVLRPSDGKHPQSIAFFQCIGSRDLSSGNGYCSSVCCMYAIKEALVAMDHNPEVKITIFYMDMRTQGKEFDYARIRAKKMGVRFVKSRIASVVSNNGCLEVVYVDYHGEHRKEAFDLIVLPEGLESPEDAGFLARAARIDLNHYNFCLTRWSTPLETSRPGIFVAGTFQNPKDVPDSVVDASGTAALVAEALKDAKGVRIAEKTYPQEKTTEEEPRIGVFVCGCGSNIAGVVDVPAVASHASRLSNVVFTDTNLYSCSQNTQEEISEKIKANRLNRVVVAACTPRTHEPLFQETLKHAGLNPCLFEMANIRDHCSWVHVNAPSEATEKSKDLVKIAVAKARLLEPLQEQKLPVSPRALVVGAGISGMTAALSIARQGYECYLMEKSSSLGGNTKQLRYLPGDEDPTQMLLSVEDQIKSHPLIRVYTNAEVEAVSGYIGNFTTFINRPNGTEALEHGVTVLAAGGTPYMPRQYLYSKSQNVITQFELEETLSERTGTDALDKLVMIQCVGSRGQDLEYCSKICCTQAVKNALKILDFNPKANITLLYRDIRTYGTMEDDYQLAREKGVNFIHFEKESPPQVTEDNGCLRVRFFDTILGETVSLEPNLLVLSVGIAPGQLKQLAKMFKIPITRDGFFMEAHPKLRPVECAVDGIYICGAAHSPKPISESIAQAKAAAAKACIPLTRGFVTVDPIVSSISQDICIGCGICESLCPYAAIKVKKIGKRKKAETISASCKGCGICASHCPTFAIYMGGFTNEQIMAQINAFGKKSNGEQTEKVE